MRRIAPLVFLALAASASADRLLTVPTARKIPYGTWRYEYRAEPDGSGQQENLLGIGIGTSFDMEVRSLRDRGWDDTKLTTDFSYNYIGALQGLVPGISVGVQDAANITPTGRRYFGALTFREPCATADGDYPLDLTLGLFAAGHFSPYVGLLLPFSKKIHLLAEHDGYRIAVGGEYRPYDWLNIRVQTFESRPLLSVQLTRRL